MKDLFPESFLCERETCEEDDEGNPTSCEMGFVFRGPQPNVVIAWDDDDNEFVATVDPPDEGAHGWVSCQMCPVEEDPEEFP